jgi:transcriptional accessory protein Tex/SPT6
MLRFLWYLQISSMMKVVSEDYLNVILYDVEREVLEPLTKKKEEKAIMV